MPFKPQILVIDDTPANLMTLGLALKSEFFLQVATSGAMGLALAQQSPPDLILLDIMMPDMDGFEVCRQLKAIPTLRDIPVIFVSALTGIESESSGLALGAVDYITKPVNVDIARQRIRNLIEREVLRKNVIAQKTKLQAQVIELDSARQALIGAQDALLASDAFKHAILNSLVDEIAVLDENGVIQAVNAPWQRFADENGTEFGSPAVAVSTGKNYLDVCRAAIDLNGSDAKIAEDALHGIESVLNGSAPGFSMEYPCHSSKHKKWLSMVVSPLQKSVQGGAVVTHSDITQRKQMMEAQRSAQEKLQLAASVFTHAREGIMITDPNGQIVEVNDAFTRITGFSRQEVLGNNPRLLSSGRQGKEFYSQLWQQVINKGHWYGEIWNRRKNGELYAEMLTISAVCDGDNKADHYVALFSDITTHKEHENHLDHIAHYDALTNLPNRVLLADRLRQGMAHAQRQGKKLVVVYLDLDGFKRVNDSHGHEAGDQLLIAVAARMKEALREGDTLARIGGDEFVAVLGDLEHANASVPMLTRLLAAAAQPFAFRTALLQVSASVGVTCYPQAQEIEADHLLRQADQAMYQAKLEGKNRYSFFDTAQDSEIRGFHKSIERIRQGLANREFVLHYQPKVNLRSGAVIGVEALIRWQHPQNGLLAPAMFLPAIENHPLAVELGEWVIHTALTQLAAWQTQGLNLGMSVNVGARQVQHPNFVLRLQEILALHANVEPTRLEIEILESSALEDLVRMSQVIEDCHALGVTVALDDFGTGYSSLTYLRHLRVHLLKIDQSYVHGMLDDADDLAVLRGVIGLANSFRRSVSAEGIETLAHGSLLLQLGCELGQGFFIARPMPAHELPDWMAHWQPNPVWRAQTAVAPENLPLLFARIEHRTWVDAVAASLRGDGFVPPPRDQRQCKFWQWLDTDGLGRYGRLPVFESIKALHHQVHALGTELLALQAVGRHAEALAKLPELEAQRDALLAELDRLEAAAVN